MRNHEIDVRELRERVPLSKAAEFLLDECRMVLPGIQALFGFQLIAVFNDGFFRRLSLGEQQLHLLAIALIAVAIALVMSPAAFHRQSGPEEITETLIQTCTRLLLWSMLPLALGICLDFYLITSMILGHSWVIIILAVLLFVLFTLMWFVLPRIARLQKTSPRYENKN